MKVRFSLKGSKGSKGNKGSIGLSLLSAVLIGLAFAAPLTAQTLDSFYPIINGQFYDALLLNDQKTLISGTFNQVNGVAVKSLARLNTDGTRDTTFTSPIGDFTDVSKIYPLSNGKYLISGGFASVSGNTILRIARLNADFTADTTFNPNLTTPVGVSKGALMPDEKLVIGFNFGGTISLRRLNTDGSNDSTFTPPTFNTNPNLITYDDVGQKLYVSGGFTTVAGVSRRAIARLNYNGTLDTSFAVLTSTSGSVIDSVKVLSSGKILISGRITGIGGDANRNYIGRLNSDGSVDTSFTAPAFAGTGTLGVFDMEVLTSGKILIAGTFSTIGGVSRPMLARLNADGTLDESFRNMNVTGTSSNYISRVGSNKYMIGVDNGAAIDGSGRNYLARITIDDEVAAVSNTPFDYDGDGKADVSVYRDGTWYMYRSAAGFGAAQFGNATDKTVPGDYDGDGKADVAVFRNGTWYWLKSSDNSFSAAQFGQTGDLPVPADLTGDGRDELAVYRGGTWYSLDLTNGGFQAVQFGISTDKPVTGDFDGDGKADRAVYRDGTWHMLRSTAGYGAVQFGIAGDKAVPADYDGDGKADQAVYRSGIWYILGSQQGFIAGQFGNSTDLPVPADYDGDGKTDMAIYRSGTWWLNQTTAGVAAVGFGLSTDKPVPASFIY